MFGVSDYWLETRLIIKILTYPCIPINFDEFSWESSKKNFFCKKNDFKMAASKNPHFPFSPILNIFW